MKQFLLNLLNADNPTSSKRLAGLSVVFTFISIAIVSTFKNSGNCPEFIYNGLLLFAAGVFGLNATENILKKKTDTSEEPSDKTNQ